MKLILKKFIHIGIIILNIIGCISLISGDLFSILRCLIIILADALSYIQKLFYKLYYHIEQINIDYQLNNKGVNND